MKHLLIENLPSAGVVATTLFDEDQTVLTEFASRCCADCAIKGCLEIAVIEDMVSDQEQIQIRILDPDQD